MSEYLHVEKPFLDQLAALGWTIVDQGCGMIPSDPALSLRENFREWLLPSVFREAVRAINPWLTDRQLEDVRSQILRQPNRTLLESSEEIQKLIFKTQVDVNEETGEADPVVKLIDFKHPEKNSFHAINQFRINTPGCVKDFIIPDIVLFVNGIPLVVVENKIGDANTANPMHAAFEQLLRYRNGREETAAAGLREGEPRLFHSNLLMITTCGEKAAYGSITSGYEHFHPWKDIWPEKFRNYTPPLGVEREQEILIQGLLPPETLLDVLRSCSVFMDTDSGKRVKVICRYQQYRAAKKMLARLRTGKDADERSGVVWLKWSCRFPLSAMVCSAGILIGAMCGCGEKNAAAVVVPDPLPVESATTAAEATAPSDAWMKMETLAPGKWTAIEGATDLGWDDESGVMRIGIGTELNGVRWTGPMPVTPYDPC